MSRKENNKEQDDKKNQRNRLEEKLGLVFPVTRLKTWLKNNVGNYDRISTKAAAAIASILEQINANILESAAQVANMKQDGKNHRVGNKHLAQAIEEDQEGFLKSLFENASLTGTKFQGKCDWNDYWKENKKQNKSKLEKSRRRAKKKAEEEAMPDTKKDSKQEKKGRRYKSKARC